MYKQLHALYYYIFIIMKLPFPNVNGGTIKVWKYLDMQELKLIHIRKGDCTY